VQEGLVKRVYNEYITHLQWEGLLISEGAQPGPSADEMTFFRSLVDSRAQKYGAHERDEFEDLYFP